MTETKDMAQSDLSLTPKTYVKNAKQPGVVVHAHF